MILPELAGKLDSIAVRAPVLNASITDAVFQLARATSVEEVNALFAEAARSQPPLEGILGYRAPTTRERGLRAATRAARSSTRSRRG